MLKISAPGKTKSVPFEPEAGVAGEYNRLKFIAGSPNNQEYLILDNMKDAYKETHQSAIIYF